MRQLRTTFYKPLARHGRVTHAAAYRRTSTGLARTDVALTAVFDRRGAHLLRGHFFGPAAWHTTPRTVAR